MLTSLLIAAGLAVKVPDRQYSKPVVPVMGCGIAPIAPMGCRYVCSCDGQGRNCTWTTVCR